MLQGYRPSRCTPFHVFGGMWFASLVPTWMAAVLFAVCALTYQLFDALPRSCPDWAHTKWDIIEVGVGSALLATMREIGMMGIWW